MITHVVCKGPCPVCVSTPGTNEIGDVPCSTCGGSLLVSTDMPLMDFVRLFTWGTDYFAGQSVISNADGSMSLIEKPMTTRNVIRVVPNESEET